MSLSQAVSAAVSGLRATQKSLATVAGNVANADTPGFVRKATTQVAVGAGDAGVGVRVASIDRELDVYVQRQLRTESSGGAYAGLRADFYQRLQSVYGDPGSDSALETVFNKFTTALQGLTTSPDSPAIRSGVLGAAQLLTQQLNGTSAQIQALRTDAELGLADAVRQANEALQQIAHINQQLGSISSSDATSAVLLDQRDNYINKLAELMDIRVVSTNHNQISVFTNSGVQLVGTQAAQLTFDTHGVLTPYAQWSDDPSERTVGTIALVAPNAVSTDLVGMKTFRSGKIAALLEMRDQILPQAQAQVDEIAAAMASALSDRNVDGAPVAGPPSGFDLDVGTLLAGNKVNLTYTDSLTGGTHKVTIIRIDDPSVLPLPDSATSDPSDKVVGVDFSGGMASVVAQLNSALGSSHLAFSNPAGNTLRALDDGSNSIQLTAGSTTSTVTTLTGGSAELPFFLDATSPYSGAITSTGPQSLGFAGRIAVNPALIADPTRLVVYQTSPLTPAGDLTRPNFIYDKLTNASREFAPQAGIGTPSTPFNGSIPSYLRQMISQQGEAAQHADNLKQGQDLVVKSLQQRFNDQSGVNVDEEMATLLQLQNAYAANARVMTTVRDLLDLLMKM
jgi:flagellar hook-associated protein 1 FlgK